MTRLQYRRVQFAIWRYRVRERLTKWAWSLVPLWVIMLRIRYRMATLEVVLKQMDAKRRAERQAAFRKASGADDAPRLG